jgi:ABC-type multidrug transport system fused ATPase/permease subunit
MAFGRKREKSGEKIKLTKEGVRKAMRVFKFLLPYKWTFAVGMVFLMLSSSASLVFPKLLGRLLEEATTDETAFSDIDTIALWLLALFALQSVFSYFRVVLFVQVTQKTLAALRKAIFGHLIHLPMQYFNKHRVGELNSRISSDISLLQETLTTTSAEFIRQIVILVGGIVMLFFVSPKLSLFMLGILPIIILLGVFYGKKLKNYSKRIQEKIADSNAIVEEALSGIANVKAFTNEFFEMRKYNADVELIKNVSIKGGKLKGAFISFIVFGVFGAVVGVVWYGVRLIREGELSIGGLSEFLLLTIFIAASIGSIGNLYAQIQKAIGASEKLMDILDQEPELVENKAEQIRLNGNIAFRHVHFAYPSRKEIEVLKDISFEISEGEQIALVGGSGAGKSTLTALLLRMYTHEEGAIHFDGKSIKEIPLFDLRNQIAIVPQEVLLFAASIYENIAYGKPDASKTEIEMAAKKAYAIDFIQSFPDGFDTLVGDRGIQLSGGQRQRIAIARAILKDPKILILDEATSALDSESEMYVQKALEDLMKNRTSIIIAHRLSTIKQVDRIFVMEEGCIVEEGSHEELIEKEEGVYQNLNKLQYS